MNNITSAVFVYGTLKRGERREHDWPRLPIAILPAIVRGELFDLDRYPGLRPGLGFVAGEYWEIAPDDLDETLRVLDEIEQYRNRDDDLYRREIIECVLHDGSMRNAYTYVFARPDRLQQLDSIPSTAEHPARWSGRSTPF